MKTRNKVYVHLETILPNGHLKYISFYGKILNAVCMCISFIKDEELETYRIFVSKKEEPGEDIYEVEITHDIGDFLDEMLSIPNRLGKPKQHVDTETTP